MEVELKQVITRLLFYACLWLTVATVPIAIAQEQPEDEILLKAAFIYNFAKFTQWPENTFNGETTPLRLCTTGDDKLIETLKRIGDRKIKGRSVRVRSLQNAQTPERCHVLYIARSKSVYLTDIIDILRYKPVLSISELPGFSRLGGVIELFSKNDRTRFIINLTNARKARLELSSHLLRLAVVVNNEEEQ